MITFCLSGLLSGILLGFGINEKITLSVSALLTLIGFLLASVCQTPIVLYLGFGILVGSGAGFSYNGILSTVSSWFPDKQGLISGILLMGYGLGSFFIGKVYQALLPELPGGWRTAFKILGILICAVVLLFLPFIKRKARNSTSNSPKEETGYTPIQMLTTSPFYLYYLWAILLSAAGLILVSQSSKILAEVRPQLAPSSAATIVGLISICNGIGRVFFGNLYDKKGYRTTMGLTIFAFLITAALLLLAILQQSLPLVIAGFILGGLSYGGVTPTNSALVNDFYGMKHYAVNFSIVGTNLVFASFGSSIAGALYDSSGSYFSSMILIASTALLGLACLAAIRRPSQHIKS